MIDHPITELKGVGEKTKEQLEDLDILTVEDLLLYFPSRYEYYEIKPLSQLQHQDDVTIVGKVYHEPTISYFGKRQSRITFPLVVDHITVRAVIFNRAFAKKHIKRGDTLTLTGRWDAHRLQITVNKYRQGVVTTTGTIEPIYALKRKMTNTRFKKMIEQAFLQYRYKIQEILPKRYLQVYKLPTRLKAIEAMHFPKNKQILKHAQRRFIYEELLIFQIKVQMLRRKRREQSLGISHHYEPVKIREFIESLPFRLTDAQERSLNEILSDMKSPYQMNRLLQGDVGSGKTIIAAISLYAAVTAGNQGAMMAPTEILAEQHYHSLQKIFNKRVTIGLLTSSIRPRERRELLRAIEQQKIDIVVGTHSLIQEDVNFSQLSYVIVDEQHRFGVEQRRLLRQKGFDPDVLLMTATPIPRTLAITAFGDMDLSIIDEMPAGRKEVKTYWVKENMFERVLRFIQKHIEQGEQAYIVCPLIEESETLDYQNVIDLYDDIIKYYPSSLKVGLLHGRLSYEEKEEVMQRFANNDIHLLVTTTVVEVGVNVPNATIMVIYDAERFGLSQLHQLRGRVGRGEKQSYCILIADPKGDVGRKRMHIMTKTSDGFKLAEKDLKLRGPGDVFGKKQSGLPDFKVADLMKDQRALETARKDALEIVEHQLLENDENYRPLGEYIDLEKLFVGKLD